MKFRNGTWLVRDGVRLWYPVQIHELEKKDRSIVIYASAKKLTGRDSSINGPLFTIRLSSPCENVIKVNVAHFKGFRPSGPQFEVTEDATHEPEITMELTGTIRAGRLSAHIDTVHGWRLEFFDNDRYLTSSTGRSIAYAITPEGNFVMEQLGLSVGECIYGLGERFSAFVKNGQSVDIWNEDPGTNSEQAYKNVPFYLSNRGYGVFVNNPGKVSFEVGSENVSKVQFAVGGEETEYFVIGGEDPKDILSRYTYLTGRPALPPAWSFGLWLTTSFTTDYEETTVKGIVSKMEECGIPLSVFHFDCFWMKEYQWCDFAWNSQVFPDPAGMIRRLKEKGLRICLWINPYIAQRSPLFTEGQERDYFLRKPNGDVWQNDHWQAGRAIVDFTNKGACRWFQEKLSALLDMGVDCFKTDFGERIPTDVGYHDGSDPCKMHNYYSYLYNKVVFDLLREKRGQREAVLFARSGTAGSQTMPVHWGGDCSSTYESMAESLRGGLSLCLSGFGFWSHDIGGFENTPTPDLYKRWCAFGLLSSHSRLHGSNSYRVPWNFDEQSAQVLRFFTRLKCRLMPYLYGCAVETHTKGIPMMRAMVLEFPNDPTCSYLDRQYMLGNRLLIAPILSSDGSVTYYLPEGIWTHFLTGEKQEGPKWITEAYDYFSLPLYVRPDSVIPVGSVDSRPDYDYLQSTELRLFEITGRVHGSISRTNIESTMEYSFDLEGTTLRFNRSRSDTDISVHVENGENVTGLSDGVRWTEVRQGLTLFCEREIDGFECEIEGM